MLSNPIPKYTQDTRYRCFFAFFWIISSSNIFSSTFSLSNICLVSIIFSSLHSRFSRTHNFKDPDHILRELKRYIQKADVPNCTIHDLRHLHATLLLKYQVNPKVVSERLGHSRVGIKLDIYAHVTFHSHDEASLRLEQSFFNKT
jgi:integrase